jgi:hypothetical protein
MKSIVRAAVTENANFNLDAASWVLIVAYLHQLQ